MSFPLLQPLIAKLKEAGTQIEQVEDVLTVKGPARALATDLEDSALSRFSYRSSVSHAGPFDQGPGTMCGRNHLRKSSPGG